MVCFKGLILERKKQSETGRCSKGRGVQSAPACAWILLLLQLRLLPTCSSMHKSKENLWEREREREIARERLFLEWVWTRQQCADGYLCRVSKFVQTTTTTTTTTTRAPETYNKSHFNSILLDRRQNIKISLISIFWQSSNWQKKQLKVNFWLIGWVQRRRQQTKHFVSDLKWFLCKAVSELRLIFWLTHQVSFKQK